MEVCIPFLIILGAVIVLVSPIVLVASISSAKRKKFQRMIAETKSDLLSRGRHFPVRYASSRKYHRFFKFYPWETTGVIYADDKEIIFYAAKIQGERNVELHFRRGEVSMQYVGTENFFTNGFTEWFFLKTYDEKHYFTSETGATIFKSGSSTREIFNGLHEVIQQTR